MMHWGSCNRERWYHALCVWQWSLFTNLVMFYTWVYHSYQNSKSLIGGKQRKIFYKLLSVGQNCTPMLISQINIVRNFVFPMFLFQILSVLYMKMKSVYNVSNRMSAQKIVKSPKMSQKYLTKFTMGKGRWRTKRRALLMEFWRSYNSSSCQCCCGWN